MKFPEIRESRRIELLAPPAGPVRCVLDTDTYNEMDDQFAVAHALSSGDRVTVEAIYAAPFHNSRSTGPGDGMEKSYQEILRLLERLDRKPEGFVHRGSETWLAEPDTPVESPAATDLVEKAMTGGNKPLYVAAIGAVTNVASALLIEPAIAERIVVVWLGGNALWWPTASEFNLKQDPYASRVLFDSGVPLVHLPCNNVTSHLKVTVPELEAYLRGGSRIGDYLTDTAASFHDEHVGWSKVIWDISASAYLVQPGWIQTEIVHSPILTQELTWSFDYTRHFILSARSVDRDAIFRDLYTKLGKS